MERSPKTRDARAVARLAASVLVSLAGGIAMPQTAGAEQPAICVAVPLPVVSGVPANAIDVGNAIRELFSGYLKGPSLKTISLDARLASLSLQEAKEKNCGLVLTATLTGKEHGGSRVGKLAGSAAGNASYWVPGAASTGASIARAAAVGTAQAVSTLASMTRAKDEVRLEFSVQTPDSTVRVGPLTQQARAEVNGEDILTPVVQRAAEQIVEHLSKSSK